jgi:nitroreductase
MVTVTEALKRRISTRAFLPTPLPLALVREILDAARWAPSGSNMQAWRIMVLAGAAAQELKDLGLATVGHDHRLTEEGDRPMYPTDLWEPYRSRRFGMGEQMYLKMGIAREDKAARIAHVRRNLEAFGAPVLMMFIIDRRMCYGQWAHLGMLMQSVVLAAEERGVATCMQESWMRIRETFHRHYQLEPTEMLYCGIALGYADPSAPVNSLRTDRMSVDELATFRGF